MQIQVVLVFSDLFHSFVEEVYIFGLATLQLNYQRFQTKTSSMCPIKNAKQMKGLLLFDIRFILLKGLLIKEMSGIRLGKILKLSIPIIRQ